MTISGWNADRLGELGPKYGARYVERPSDEGVNELFNQATVFVQTSTHEGFCLPPLEAMATGGAVVCTDAHGNRDFCVDGENCLIPAPTVAAVSAAISTLLADPELRKRLVTGRQQVQAKALLADEREVQEVVGVAPTRRRGHEQRDRADQQRGGEPGTRAAADGRRGRPWVRVDGYCSIWARTASIRASST
jgi:hypothetical protein